MYRYSNGQISLADFKQPVEFGAKLDISVVDGWTRLECGPCDRHVRSGAESPQDSARSFENARISSGDSRSEQKLGTCSVDIR